MTKVTTIWALYDLDKPKKKKTYFNPETDDLSEEIQHKLKLIEKAFK